MRAAFIIYSDTDFGGAERRLIRLHNKMAEYMDTDLIVRGTTTKRFYEILKKADCYIDKFSNLIVCKNNFEAIFYVLKGHYEVVHFFDLCGFNYYISCLCPLRKTRTLCTIAYQNYAYGMAEPKTLDLLAKLLKRVDRVDVLFPAGQSYFKSLTGKDNITVTPGTFTDLSTFLPGRKKNLMVFAAARLQEDKNASLLIQACLLCQEELRSKGYKVWVLGQGYQEEELKKLVTDSHIDDVVLMKGYQKASECLPMAKVFFSLDLYDNHPSQSLAEAIACGCYVIATDVGYTKRGMGSSFSKLVKGTPEELSVAIIEYINFSEDIHEQFIGRARVFAEEHYGIQASEAYFYRLLTST